MKKLMFGLLTLTALGVISLPASADDAKIQTSTQVTTQHGEGNTSFQRSSQEIRHRSNGKTRNSGHVQDVYHDVYQDGVDNYSHQESSQQIEIRRHNRGRKTRIHQR